MKKTLILLLCALGVVSSEAQQILDLHTGRLNREQTSTVPIRDIEELKDGYMVTYTFDKAMVRPDKLFSGTYFWEMDGFGMNNTSGEPRTLLRNDLISVPFGYSAKVEVTDSSYCDFDYELTPARQPLLNSSNEIYTRQNVLAIKPYKGFMPAEIVSQSGILSYRGHKMCQTTVRPIQYNYATKTVRAYTSITYKVTYIPDQDTTKQIVKPSKISLEDHFLSNNVIGPWLKKKNNAKSSSSSQADVRDYLILTISPYAEAAYRLAAWKRLMGFNVHVVIRDIWRFSSVVKGAIHDANIDCTMDGSTLDYILLLGDYNDLPAKTSSLHIDHISDFSFGCIEDDDIQDAYCGRLSVSTTEEALTVVDKIINYERNPPTAQSFYNNALHCAYFQDENNDGIEDRRFIETSEDIRTYVMNKGKYVRRVYTTPSNVTPLYWNNDVYSNGGSIPDELKKPGFTWNGNATDISNAINNGVFYVYLNSHGEVTKWNYPEYTQQNISNLTNGNLLPVVFSMACSTGKFDEDCFAETFLRKSNGGCVAIFGATQTCYSGYDDALSTGMFDAIWPNPGLHITIPNTNNSFSTTPEPTYELGQIMAQGMARVAETYGSTDNYVRYTKEVYHCFGDPSMKIYTELPTAFSNVSVVRSSGSVSVSLASGEEARITTYDPITGDVQSFIGNSATVTTPNPGLTTVCVSGHNRIPFIQEPGVLYIQNTNITGTLNETRDVIKVGNHVTPTIPSGNVTTSAANITLNGREVLLDRGTSISAGSTLHVNP